MPASRPLPAGPRRVGAGAALVAGLAACLLAATGCTGLAELDRELEQQQDKRDDKTKLAHYEETAQTYYDGGRYTQSAMQWRKVLELEPDRPKANWGLAKSLAMIGTVPALREAEQLFARIQGWNWTHPTLGDRRHEVLKDFAEVYVALADFYDRDVRALQRRLESPDVDPTTTREQLRTQAGKRNELLNQAIPLFDQVLARSPDNPYALAGLAKAHLMVGNDQAGVAWARRYVELAMRTQAQWQAQLKAEQEHRGSGMTDEMREWYRGRIQGSRDKELKLRLLVAAVLMRTGDPMGAVKEYDRVIELDPAVPAPYLERAQAYARGNSHRLAVADLEHYLKITDPVNHRDARIKAADLLNQYRVLASATVAAPGSSPPASTPSGAPGAVPGTLPPPPPPPPVPFPSR